MMLRRCALLLLVIICAVAGRAPAQPVLPNIAASTEKGVIMLSWECQYTGVKSIAVLHSTDSNNNYKTIGYVKKLDKGVQAYVDGHANTGRNYYKLSITFASGVVWTSNRARAYIDVNKLSGDKLLLPQNDSLQQFIVTREIDKPGTVALPHYELKPDSEALAIKAGEAGHKVSLSIDAAKLKPGAPVGKTPASDAAKINLSFDEPGLSPMQFVRSAYINADPATGNINMTLPDDVRRHRYAVKFFDAQNGPAIEIPLMNAAKVIIDRRNFRKKGQYKFILLKDGAELETGNVMVGLK